MQSIIEFKDFPAERKKRLNEVFNYGYQFAMLTADGSMSTQWMFCKDYFNEIVWHALHNGDISVYGMALKKDEPPADIENPKIAVKVDVDEVRTIEVIHKSNECALKLLNLFEEKAGWADRSQIVHVPDKNISIFLLAKQWINSPTLLSLATCCMRYGFGWTGSTLEELFSTVSHVGPDVGNDANGFARYKEFKWWEMDLNEFVKENLADNYPENAPSDVHTLHNNSGIMSYLRYKYLSEGLGINPFNIWKGAQAS